MSQSFEIEPYRPELQLTGSIFVGWPDPPSESVWHRLMAKSDEAWVATIDGKVVGFVTALTDRVMFASVTCLEVIPEFQSKGIGKALLLVVRDRLQVYAIDLVCDESVVPFYESLGMKRIVGMGWRDYDRQSGL